MKKDVFNIAVIKEYFLIAAAAGAVITVLYLVVFSKSFFEKAESFDAVCPRITRSKPERGAVDVMIPNTFGISGLEAGNTNLFLVFDFSKPMEKESVEKAVVITPFAGRSFSWMGARRLIVKCDALADENPIKPNTQYKVEFKEGPAAIDGKKLVKPKPFIFSTGGLKFIGSSLAAAKLHPPSNKTLEFYFNFPVDKRSVSASNIVIYPGLKGRLELGDNKENQINFIADRFFPSDTAFSVTLKKGLKGKTGAALGADVAVNFTTEPLKVIITWPKDEDNNILTSGFPYIFFNSEVKKEAVEKAISIKPDITAELAWKTDDTNMEYCILKHKPYFNASTEYVININDSITDLYGKKLKEPYKFRFKTESCRVSCMQPAEGSVNVAPKSGIKIIFNTIMNQEETEKFISIEPKADVVFLWNSPDNYDILNIEARNGWESHASYIFRVAKEAKGKNGESLTKDFKGIIYIK
ncbi:MAG: Ig-like domain-containing protein [Candidatus Firestonebacteria bacterium]